MTERRANAQGQVGGAAQGTTTGSADQTHGSPQRDPRDLGGGPRTVAISEAMERLRREPAFQTDGRNSETVLHDGIARVVLTALAEDREVGSDVSDGYISMVLVEGAGDLSQGSRQMQLMAGDVALLTPGAPWSFHASEPCAIVSSFWQPD